MSTSSTPPGRHEATEPLTSDPSFLAEVRDAIAPRTVSLVVGVLLLQLAFILSYVGAFHSPKPHHIEVAVVAPAQVSARTVAQLNGLPSAPIDATPAADEATAQARLREARTAAVLVIDPTGTRDTLLVASGGGTAVATAVETVLTEAEASQHRTLATRDVIATQAGDARGLSGFYLVIGWIVGGYLVAALLGVAKGSRPATTRRAIIRLLALIPYAILSGLGGVVLVGPVLGALTGHLLALWGLGTLLVLAAATVTMAFQVLFGVLGIGVTVLLFVVLGNPSAGGAYQPALLPPFWRALSPALPNGAGTDAVRRIVYFGSHGITSQLLVICCYAVVGSGAAVGASALHHRQQRAQPA